MIAILQPGDEPKVQRFLERFPDTTLILRSNLRRGGVGPGTEGHHGTWAALLADGEVVSIVTHFSQGNLVMQAPHQAAALALEATRASGLAVRGLIGPWEQVVAVQDALQLSKPATEGLEDLFALDLSALAVPAALANGQVSCRPASTADLETLAQWRYAYSLEALHQAPGDVHFTRQEMEHFIRSGSRFVLETGGQLVAMSGFNARVPDCVQVGGVWTPMELRGRGYARAVVAGSLLIARAEGATRSVLFTDKKNFAAQKAYVALGYKRIGEYGLILYPEPRSA